MIPEWLSVVLMAAGAVLMIGVAWLFDPESPYGDECDGECCCCCCEPF